MFRDEKWYTCGLALGVVLGLGKTGLITSSRVTKSGVHLVGRHKWAWPVSGVVLLGWGIKKWGDVYSQACREAYDYQVLQVFDQAYWRGYSYRVLERWLNSGVDPQLILYLMGKLSWEEWEELVSKPLDKGQLTALVR